MSNIIIKEVIDKKQFKAFVKFPFDLYSNSEHWIPPIIADELEDFDPKRNPAYEYAISKHWLAYQNEKIVGRIAAIKHKPEFIEHQKIRFGWVDFIDDVEVSKHLFQTVEYWAIQEGANAIHGPMGFNDFDFQGTLIEGFEVTGTIATIYNHPYYKDHFEKLGFQKVVDWIELSHDFTEEVPERLARTANFVLDRFDLNVVPVHSKKDIMNRVEEFFEVVNITYSSLFGFYSLTTGEKNRIIKKYFSFLSPKYVAGVMDKSGKLVAFGITMPSLSEAFKKAKGRLFPFGFFHLLKALKFNKSIDLYLVGVLPEYRNSGVLSVVYHELWKKFKLHGVTKFHSNPAIDDNAKVLNLWRTLAGKKEIFEEKIVKRRRLFEKLV